MKKRRGYSITQFFYLNLQTLIFIRKMKQLKFLMIAFTLLMGISLTSCLNSDSDTYDYGGGMMRVHSNYMTGGYVFKSADGSITVTPTAASIASIESRGFKFSEVVNKVVQLTYRWDTSLLTIPKEEKDIQGVEIYSIEVLDGKLEIVETKGAANDSLTLKNNAPIITMSNNEGGTNYAPQFYDDNTILLPINYFMSKIHFLTLVYYPNEDKGSTLKLYLAHNSNGDTGSSNTTSFDYAANGAGLGLFYKIYDLQNVIRHHGSEPTSIEIVTSVNRYSSKLDDPQTEEKIFVVTKKENSEK